MSEKGRIAGLLNRIIFIDLALAVAVDKRIRKEWLRKFIAPKVITANYKAFRSSVRRIYNVQLPLDISPPPTKTEIEDAIRATCNKINLERNLSASLTLFDFLTPFEFDAYPHEVKQLRISPHRKVAFELAHYLVRDGKAVFQYPYPRSKALTGMQVRVMLHLIKEAYCTDDFEDAEVELLELSRNGGSQHRQTILHNVSSYPPFLPGELEDEITSVHDMLIEISEE